MPSTDVNGDLLLLGRGKVYFDRFDANGAKQGERFLGNCTRLEITTTDDLLEKFSSATKDSPLMKSVNRQRVVELALTMDEFDPANVALALMGDEPGTFSQTSGSATNEAITGVKQGHFYPVGGAAPKRQISSVVVTGPVGTPTYTVTTDYIVDAVSGRIYIVPGGGIADGADIEVDYSYAAITALTKIAGGTKGVIEGFLRFIGDPATGPAYELEVWKVSITPDGALGFISEDFAENPIKAKVLDDSANHASEPLYRLLKLS